MPFNTADLNADCKSLYERVREEFYLVADLGGRADIDSAMLNVNTLLEAYAKSLEGLKKYKICEIPLR